MDLSNILLPQGPHREKQSFIRLGQDMKVETDAVLVVSEGGAEMVLR